MVTMMARRPHFLGGEVADNSAIVDKDVTADNDVYFVLLVRVTREAF